MLLRHPAPSPIRSRSSSSKNWILACLSALVLITAPPWASAQPLYWDVNGNTTAFGTITGAWNGTNAFWNTSSTGSGGTLIAVTTNADDLNISAGTTGTITVTNAPVASSLTFAANVTTTVTGSTLTLGGTGAKSGIFANSSAASTITGTGIILAAPINAFNFSNSGTGLLSVGAITGAATSGTQTVTIGSSSTGGITLSGIIGNGAAGGNVALVINSTGSGITTIPSTGVNTFTGGVTIKSGNVTVGVSNSGTASGAFGPSASGVTLGDTTGSANATILSGNTISNAITVVAGSTGNTLKIGNSTATNGATFSGALTLNHDLSVVAQGTGAVTLSGAIGGAGNLDFSGTGTGTISGAGSTYTGNLSFSAGQLNLNEASALGGNGGSFIFSGQKLDNTSGGALTYTSTKTQQWNSDFTFLGSRSMTFGTGAITLGGNRIITVNSTLSGNTLAENGGIGDGGNGYSLTKAGAGTLTLNGANTYTGATTVMGGILNLNGAASTLSGTSSLTISGGTVVVGVTSGTGVASRINPAAPLTLGGSTGGGTLQLSAGATAPVNSHAFPSLTVNTGSNLALSSSTTNAATLSFTGAGDSVYTRTVGGTIRFQGLAGSSSLFVNAPTGSSVIGSGTSAILIGAVSGTSTNLATDFVQATAGAPTAPTYVNNIWASGNNTNVTLNRTIVAGAVTQSLRFNDPIPRTVTLSGTSTIESGGILVTSAATGANSVNQPQSITGGTLQAPSGSDLWVFVAGTGPTDLSISSLIGDNGGSSLTKAGARILYLTNAGNSYAGGTYLNEGTLNITSGGALGALSGPLNFGGSSTLQAGAANVDLSTRAISIAGVQTATLDTAGNNISSGGVISGTGNLNKISNGILTLSGANTYTGTTNVQQGTLKLDFSAAGAPTSNIIASGNTVITGQYVNASTANSATVQIQGADNTANTQTFGNVVIGRGAGHLNLAAGSGTGTLVVNLGTITRNTLLGVIDAAAPQGSTLDISVGANVTLQGTSSTTNNIVAPSGHAAVTLNGTTWAAISGGNIVAYTGYATTVVANTTNLDVIGTSTTLSLPPASISSVRFNSNAATTLNLAAGGVRQITTGGILVTPNVGANLTTIGAGLLAGASRRDLILLQNNTLGDLQIDATIVDYNAGAQVNTKSGLGKVIMTASNTNTGSTFINEGTLVVTGDVIAAPTGITGSTSGSSTTVSVSTTAGLFLGQAVSGNTTYFPTTALPTYTIVAIDSINNTITLSVATSGGAMPAGTPLTFGGAGALGTGAVAHVIAPGATLQIGDGGTTGALVTTQTITDNGTLILNRGNDLTFANVVSGIGSVEKQGAGNATFSVANTYTGDTRIAGGSIIMGNATAFGTGTLDYNSYGGTLSFGTLSSATLGGLKGDQDLALTNVATTPAAVALTVGGNHQNTTYSGDLSGLGSVSKTGGGTLTFSGDNTYAGSTNANNGGLTISGTHTGNGNFAVSNAATLTISGTVNGSGSYTVNSGTFNLSGSVNGVGSLIVGNNSLPAVMNLSGAYTTAIGKDFTVGANTGVAVLNVLPGASLTNLNTGTTNGSFSIGTGGGSTGVVNQTGGVVSVEGTFQLGAASGTAVGYGFYNQSGGTFINNGSATSGSRFRIGNAAGSNIGMYYLSGGTSTYTSGNNSIEVGGSGTFTNGSNAYGVLYVSGTGSLTGLTSTLSVAGQGAAGTGSGTVTGQLTVGGAGSTSASVTVLKITTAAAQPNQLGTASINLLSGGTLITGDITKGANGTSNINFNGGTLKVGTNNTTFNAQTGVYSYAGGATIDTNGLNYTVSASILAPSGSGVSSIAIADGGLDYAGAPGVLISGGTGTGATAIAQVENGVVTGITLTNPGTGYLPTDVLTVTLMGGGSSTPATVGTIAFATNTSGGLTKNNAGTLALRGANTYTGETTINDGTLALSQAGSLADTSAVNLTAATSVFGISGITAAGETIGSLKGVAGSSVVLGAKALTVGGDDGSATFAGVISGSGGSLIKTGLGTQTLTGSNNYTGVTTVNAGALQVGKNGLGTTGTGAVTVNNATLLGTGTVQGSSFTLASGATLRPGDGMAATDLGTLTFSPTATGAYNFDSGSTIVLGISDPANHDLLSFGGTAGSTLTFSGNILVEPAGFTPSAGQLFDLIDWMAAVTANFSSFDVGANLRDGSGDNGSQFDLPDISGSGFAWDISQFTTNGSISIAAVPEPSRAVLLLAGLAALGLRRRRVKAC